MGYPRLTGWCTWHRAHGYGYIHGPGKSCHYRGYRNLDSGTFRSRLESSECQECGYHLLTRCMRAANDGSTIQNRRNGLEPERYSKTSSPTSFLNVEDKTKARWHDIKLYAASKALSEQGSFAWIRKHAPIPSSFKTVVPNVDFDITISPPNMGYCSTVAVLDAVVKGYAAAPSILPLQWYVDVEDTALLHLAALTREDVHDERLLAFAGQYSWTQILEILHRRFPGRIVLKALPTDGQEVVDNRRSIEVLKLMGKKEGFTSLEATLRVFGTVDW